MSSDSSASSPSVSDNEHLFELSDTDTSFDDPPPTSAYDINSPDDTTHSTVTSDTSDSPSLTGGRTASSPPKRSLQSVINQVLYRNVPINLFIQRSIDMKVKNTVGITCKKCHSDNVFSESRQLRAADEATTILYTCLNCGNRWKMN